MEKRKNIVIRAANKGGAIVILIKKNYEGEMIRLLSVKEKYKKLAGNPTRKLRCQLQKIREKGRKVGILTDKEAKYLVP